MRKCFVKTRIASCFWCLSSLCLHSLDWNCCYSFHYREFNFNTPTLRFNSNVFQIPAKFPCYSPYVKWVLYVHVYASRHSVISRKLQGRVLCGWVHLISICILFPSSLIIVYTLLFMCLNFSYWISVFHFIEYRKWKLGSVSSRTGKWVRRLFIFPNHLLHFSGVCHQQPQNQLWQVSFHCSPLQISRR